MSNPFEPKLQPGRRVPFQFIRLCPKCGNYSLFISYAAEFFMVCRWYFCKDFGRKQFVPCVLKHRKYEKKVFSMVLSDAMVFNEFGDPDVHHDVFSPNETIGPYEDCPGILSWDINTAMGRDTFVLCNVCHCRYHLNITASSGVSGDLTHHHEFRICQNSKGERTVSQKREDWAKATRVYSLQKDILCIVSEILDTTNRRITEPMEFIGLPKDDRPILFA